MIPEQPEMKMLPDYGQGATQMFSQRNNPYCELLSGVRVEDVVEYKN